MACNTGSRKKKIAILSSMGAAGVIGAFALSVNNPALAGASTFLPLAACPAMCVAMGGVMWLIPRIAGRIKPTTTAVTKVSDSESLAVEFRMQAKSKK